MKKYLFVLLISMLFLFAGCQAGNGTTDGVGNKPNDIPTEESKKPEIIVSGIPSTMKLGEQIYFNVSISNQESQEYIIVSTPDNILNVEGNKITALNSGVATISIISKIDSSVFKDFKVVVLEDETKYFPSDITLTLTNTKEGYTTNLEFTSNGYNVVCVVANIGPEAIEIYPNENILSTKDLDSITFYCDNEKTILYDVNAITIKIKETELSTHIHQFEDGKCTCGDNFEISDFPIALKEEELNTHIQRNEEYVNDLLKLLDSYYDNNQIDEIINYIESRLELKLTQYNMGYIGFYAYNNFAKKTNNRPLSDYQSSYAERYIKNLYNDIDDCYLIASEMIKIEYLWDYIYDDTALINRIYYCTQNDYIYNVYISYMDLSQLQNLYLLFFEKLRFSKAETNLYNKNFESELETLNHEHMYVEGFCKCGKIDPNLNTSVITCKEDPTQNKCLDPSTWDWNYNENMFDGKGTVITIYHGTPNEIDPDNIDSTANEKQKVNKYKVEKYYNVDLVIEKFPDSAAWGPDRVAWIKNSVSNGTVIGPTIFSISSDWITSLSNSDTIHPLEEIEYNEGKYVFKEGVFSEYGYDYNNANLLLTSFDNKIYGYSNEKIHADFFLYYNQDLIEEYNLEDPATLWNNGEWDWSKFMEFLRTAQNAFGPAEETGMYAFGGWINEVALGTLAARGSKFVDIEKKKVLLTDQSVIHMYEDLRQIKREGMWALANNDVCPGFVAGTQLFQPAQLWFLSSTARFASADPNNPTCDFEISVVPYPTATGDGKNKEYYTIPLTSTSCYVLGKNLNNVAIDGINYNILFNILYDFLNGYKNFDTREEYIDFYDDYILSAESMNAMMSVDDKIDEYGYNEYLLHISKILGNGSDWHGEGFYIWGLELLNLEKDVETILSSHQASYQAALDALFKK